MRQADVLAEDMDEKQTIALARKCIEYYVANAKPRERTGAFVDRIGIEDLKKGVL